MNWLELWQGVAPGLIRTVFLLIVIVIPLSVLIEVTKSSGLIRGDRPAGSIGRLVSRVLGISENAVMPLTAGFIFGLAYGAGLILQYAEEGELSHRDRVLIVLFLVGCHAVIEDTLIFVPLGVNPFFLFTSRFVLAILLTAIAARLVPSLRAQHKTVSTSSEAP